MSRIFVRGLPKHLKDDRLRTHFERGGDWSVTDARIMKTKDGKSRQFGYVGFLNPESAQAAIKHFNRTFIDTSRIFVEVSKRPGDEDLGRPWSRYSKGSSRYQGESTGKRKKISYKKKNKLKKKLKALPPELRDPAKIDDPELKEFLLLMQRRSNAPIWANDVLGAPGDRDGAAGSRARGDRGVGADADVVNVPGGGGGGESTVDDDGSAADGSKARKRKRRRKKRKADGDGSGNGSGSGSSGSGSGNSDGPNRKRQKTEAGSGEYSGDDEDEYSAARSEGDDAAAGRLFVRNLPFSATEDDVRALFEPFGELGEVHMVVDSRSGQSKGFAFVSYIFPMQAAQALSALDGSIALGRLIHVMVARAAEGHEEDGPGADGGAGADGASSYKVDKFLADRKTAGKASYRQNSLFMRADTVAAAAAATFGVEKADLLDVESSNTAVRMALAETHIIQETKEALSDAGVNVAALEAVSAGGAAAVKAVKRSKHVILLKNISFETTAASLTDLFARYGVLGRVVVPPTKTLALIEFVEANHAKSAFRSLAYRKHDGVPLYLEWAPRGVFTDNQAREAAKSKADAAAAARTVASAALAGGDEATADGGADNDNVVPGASLFVRNLAFQTDEDGLRAAFAVCRGVRSITIATKRDPKRDGALLSRGFGFVEFDSAATASKALQKMQGAMVDGHALQLAFAKAREEAREGDGGAVARRGGGKRAGHDSSAVATAPPSKTATKILVKNFPFEGTRNDLYEIFGSFGQIQGVRVPRKFDGTNRGFAFVDFLTHQEALNAIEALANTHYYGRHLVLEWAQDDASLAAVKERTMKYYRDQQETMGGDGDHGAGEVGFVIGEDGEAAGDDDDDGGFY